MGHSLELTTVRFVTNENYKLLNRNKNQLPDKKN